MIIFLFNNIMNYFIYYHNLDYIELKVFIYSIIKSIIKYELIDF